MGTATKKALADAAMGIGSEFERGRALNALTRAGVLTAAVVAVANVAVRRQ